MSTNVTLNGNTYAIPAEGDDGWGTVLSNYFIAISTGVLQKTGGTFSLTAEANFGATYGLKSAYLKSQAANPSGVGAVRLGNTEGVYWRNAANSADLGLVVNASNALQYNGASLIAAGAASIVNADISASAAIAYSKLNLTGAILNADLAGAVSVAKGGTGQTTKAPAFDALSPMSASGDIIYGGTSGTGTRLAKGTDGQVLTLASGLPAWAAGMTNPMSTGGDLVYGGASGAPTRLANGSSGQYLKSNGGTAAPSWQTLTTPTVQRFTSGSGTYTTPANVRYIVVTVVGGGGGGGGCGTSGGPGGTGGTGGSSTFGTSLLTAAGGGPGAHITSNGTGGTGGAATINSPALNVIGAAGSRGGSTTALAGMCGGNGGPSILGGAGCFGVNEAGTAAASNSGSGGGGSSNNLVGAILSSAGGGSGAGIKAIIFAPSATYAYAVGSGGTAGTAGTSGFAGGAGGSGVVIVQEFYQ